MPADPSAPAAPAAADAAPTTPVPVPEAKPEPAAAPVEAKAPEGVAQPEVGAKAEEPSTLVGFLGHKLPLSLQAQVQYRQLTVVDQDPANDRSGLFDFGLTYKPMKGVSAFLTFGVLQKGVADPDESGTFFKDMSLGASYTTELGLENLGLDLYAKEKARLAANLRVWFPTSRASLKQTLYVAPELRLSAEAPVLPDWISVGLEVRSTYRFHHYAERVGSTGAEDAPMNVRFTVQAIPYLEAELLKLGKYGTVNFEGDVWWTWVLKYPSRESYESATSSREFWSQQFGWDLALVYHPKPWAKVAVSLEQGANILRDGIVNMSYDLRDELELAATLTLTF
ncbi:MAG: hypothetical protein QM765_46125 [Myxococcales bacterium]